MTREQLGRWIERKRNGKSWRSFAESLGNVAFTDLHAAVKGTKPPKKAVLAALNVVKITETRYFPEAPK